MRYFKGIKPQIYKKIITQFTKLFFNYAAHGKMSIGFKAKDKVRKKQV